MVVIRRKVTPVWVRTVSLRRFVDEVLPGPLPGPLPILTSGFLVRRVTLGGTGVSVGRVAVRVLQPPLIGPFLGGYSVERSGGFFVFPLVFPVSEGVPSLSTQPDPRPQDDPTTHFTSSTTPRTLFHPPPGTERTTWSGAVPIEEGPVPGFTLPVIKSRVRTTSLSFGRK